MEWILVLAVLVGLLAIVSFFFGDQVGSELQDRGQTSDSPINR
jgi:hypothetical protein